MSMCQECLQDTSIHWSKVSMAPAQGPHTTMGSGTLLGVITCHKCLLTGAQAEHQALDLHMKCTLCIQRNASSPEALTM
eukprot:1161645-Pelagomonas_calceolata.AAC.26